VTRAEEGEALFFLLMKKLPEFLMGAASDCVKGASGGSFLAAGSPPKEAARPLLNISEYQYEG
jgi:hypothetical protein